MIWSTRWHNSNYLHSLCNFILSKVRHCCFMRCTSNCRNHLLLHNSPMDDNDLVGHYHLGVLLGFCFQDMRKELRSGSASLPETHPSGTQEFSIITLSYFTRREELSLGQVPLDAIYAHLFLNSSTFSRAFTASPLMPISIQSFNDSSTPFIQVHCHHHVCTESSLIPLPKKPRTCRNCGNKTWCSAPGRTMVLP